MTQTLVVGGEASFVKSKLTPQLARHGLTVASHWEWMKEKGAFPDATEAVFILTDMAGHHLNDAAKNQALPKGIPIIYGVRKHAVNIQRLTKAGFPLLPTTTTTPETEPMATLNHSSRAKSLRGEARSIYDRVLFLLAATPSMSNRALSESLNVPYGSTGEPARAGRETLGITDENGGQSVKINRPTYEAACAALGVAPVSGSHYPKSYSTAVPPTATPAPVLAAALVSPPPAPTPVAAPAPKPAPAPAPAPVPRDDNADLKDLVSLIRAEMGKRNITQLIVTPDGVEATKVVTVTENLGF
jgi:hypothetical protein